jgi:pyruvate/2-oxoglutarate dehydrogenase complex dihydrolipoamide acyltransferase (E2) component
MQETLDGNGLSPVLMARRDVDETERLVPSEGRRVIMNQQHADYQLVPYPKIRRWMAVAYRSAQHKPMIHGLIEVDVTRARAFLREHKAKTGESLSFTAFIIACLGKAVDENKSVQALRKGRKQLILFDDVDVATPIERDVSGQMPPIQYTIKAANRKTFREIHHEIRAAQVETGEKAWEGFKAINWSLFLPTFLFKPLFWVFSWIVRMYPQTQKKYWGTVGISAVGMFGKGAGWGIPPAPPTLMITLGGISEKPGVVDRHIAIREYLSMTISFDHDIIDGAPAARFTQRLKDLIESGFGLIDQEVGSALNESIPQPAVEGAPGRNR